jgi:hypothetical protein
MVSIGPDRRESDSSEVEELVSGFVKDTHFLIPASSGESGIDYARALCERKYSRLANADIQNLLIASEGIDLGHALAPKVYGATTCLAPPLLTSADALRETLQTAFLPKAFGTLNASGDSKESHGVHLVPFCRQIETYIKSQMPLPTRTFLTVVPQGYP